MLRLTNTCWRTPSKNDYVKDVKYVDYNDHRSLEKETVLSGNLTGSILPKYIICDGIDAIVLPLWKFVFLH